MNRRSSTRFRKIDGILLLDKPRGLSSNQALQRVRHLFRADKGGHTGSLDPLATGLFDELAQRKYTVPNDDLSKLDELQKAIDTKLAAVAQG